MKLVRKIDGDFGTFGELKLPSGEVLYICEPRDLGNTPNVSCIPSGSYTVIPWVSPTFGKSFKVLDVPDRSHILIHSGNVGGDVGKGLKTHTQGCLLPGTSFGWLTINGKAQQAVLNSKGAMRKLFTFFTQPFNLEISYV